MRDLDRFLEEDLDARGDVTTRALFGRKKKPARARIFTRESCVVAGLPEATEVLERMGARVVAEATEGHRVATGSTLLFLRGPVQGILAAERLALNLLGRMCGIATETRRLQSLVTAANPACRVAGTRKTTPGFRAFEKRAIAVGGGDPHRYGLYDGVLIKDNHLFALGSVAAAVARGKKARLALPIEVEVSSRRDAVEAARAGADWILLDNMPVTGARAAAQAARNVNPRVRIECSGGLRPERLASFARFSDRLSLGRLTHSARSADVSLELLPSRSAKA